MTRTSSFLGRLLALIGVVVLPWLAAMTLTIVRDRQQAEAAALASVRDRSAMLARDVEDTLQRARRLLDFLSQRPEIVRGDGAACQVLLTGLVGLDPVLANAGFADLHGKPLCVSVNAQAMPGSVADKALFRAALAANGDMVVSKPRRGLVVDRQVLTLARSVTGAGSGSGAAPSGVLAITLDLQTWSQGWRQHVGVDGGSLVLQDTEGTIVGRYPDPARWIGHDAKRELDRFRERLPDGMGLGTGVDGMRRFYATTPVSLWGWTAVAGVPEDVVLTPARQGAWRAAAALALLTALVLWLAWRLSRRLVAPLAHLSATAHAVAEGRPKARADEGLPGEFATVAIEFNRMLDKRDQALARLAASERRFRDMLDTVELFAVAVDAEGRISYCNGFFLRRTGWSMAELGGEDFGERCVPPERRADREQWRDALREDRLPAHSEAAILTRDGERRWVRWSSTMLRDEHGAIVGRASIGEDATDRHQAERQVQRLSGFLAALSRTQRAIIHRAERDHLLQEACSACVEAGQAGIASAWLRVDGLLRMAAWAGPADRLFGPLPAAVDPGAGGFEQTLTGRALFDGLAGISNDLLRDPDALHWRDRVEVAGVRAQAVFPLRCAGEIVGVMLLHMDEPDWFDDALVELLGQLTDDLAFALDNLQRERTSQELRRQSALDHRRFKSIFEASPMGIAVRRLSDGRLLDVNPVFCERVGMPREALLGRSMVDLGVGMTPEDSERLMAAMRDKGRVRDFETRVRDLTGRERYVLFNGEVIEYDGRPAVLTISHDVTASRHAERALAARERQLAGIVDSAMDAIITIDAEQRVLMFNRAACKMFRVSVDQVLGQTLEAFMPPELAERHHAGVRAFIDSGKEQAAIAGRRVLYGLRSDGERFAFEAAVSRQGEGAQMTMTAVIHDLTERLAADAAREARIVAEVASQAKTEFLSRMSHELRTPLNAMLGFAQLLSNDPREPLSPRQDQQLALIRDAGWHLLALIDDVLDVSRIEAGQMEMQRLPVPLRPLLESALSVSASLAERQQVRLQPLAAALPGELAVVADPTRLRQVVLNLLSNGCKYNRPGGEVALEVHDEGEQLRLDVVDNGAGMSAEQLSHLFEPFNRLGREHGAVEGTGIGLHLTRQLVRRMGGTIEAHSAAGRGTRMSVRLPKALPVDGPRLPVPAGAAGGGAEGELAGRVLYIEDNPVNLMLVEQFLLRWPQVHLTSADTGAAGLRRVRSERFDLVLLDMQLPDTHGTEVLASLRADERLKDLPVVALSASAMPEAVDAALGAGATEYWTKPLNLARLAADLRRFLRTGA